MKHFVIQFLDKLSIVLFVLLVLAGFGMGYQQSGIAGAILGLLGSFLAGALMFGALFILLEMNENLRAIRKATESKQS